MSNLSDGLLSHCSPTPDARQGPFSTLTLSVDDFSEEIEIDEEKPLDKLENWLEPLTQEEQILFPQKSIKGEIRKTREF